MLITRPRPGPRSAAAGAGTPPAAARRRARLAHLSVRGANPWSAAKLAATLSVAVAIAVVVAVTVLYLVLQAMGVIASLGPLMHAVTAPNPRGDTSSLTLLGVLRVTVEVVVAGGVTMTAFATVAAWLSRVVGDLVTGVEVTFAESLAPETPADTPAESLAAYPTAAPGEPVTRPRRTATPCADR